MCPANRALVTGRPCPVRLRGCHPTLMGSSAAGATRQTAQRAPLFISCDIRTSLPLLSAHRVDFQGRYAPVGQLIPVEFAVPSTQEPRSCHPDRVTVTHKHEVPWALAHLNCQVLQFTGKEPADTAVHVQGALTPTPADVADMLTGRHRLRAQGAGEPALEATEGLLS